MRTIHVFGVLLLMAPSAVAQGISQVPEIDLEIDPCPTEQVEDISGLADRIDCVEATFMALLREMSASSARGLQGIVDVLGLFERNIQSGVVEQAVARVGAWEAVGTDLKIVIEDTVEYEYGLVRNGGFRTLTASTWNGGWRVMTSPHMTGDFGEDDRVGVRFRLGGSMWIWDTHDPRDDGGLYHYYYYYTPEGVVTFAGNGLRSGGGDSGEGLIYRRPR